MSTRTSNIISVLVFLILSCLALVLIFLPVENLAWLASIWTAIAVLGNLACLQTVRTRWRQRREVLNPRRIISSERRHVLLSIATANVRRELVRVAEFGVLFLLGVLVLLGWTTPLLSRAIIIFLLLMLLGNVIYDLLEMAYTDQFLDATIPASPTPILDTLEPE